MTVDDFEDLCPECQNCGHPSCDHLMACEWRSEQGLWCSCAWDRKQALASGLAVEALEAQEAAL